MLIKLLKKIIQFAIAIPMTIIIFIVSLIYQSKPNQKPRLLWGPMPIKNWSYAARAMAELGYKSHTIMNGFYHNINSVNDFDFFCETLFAQSIWYKLLPQKVRNILIPYLVLI